MRKFFVLISFFTLTPGILVAAIMLYGYVGYAHSNQLLFPLIGHTQAARTVAYAALPTAADTIDTAIGQSDSRVERLQSFFNRYKSPLTSLAGVFVQEADKNKLDYRLTASIAMQESTLCKKALPNTNNCWGYGIHGGQVMKFDSYEEAVKTVSKSLGKNYAARGLVTPEQIGPVYNPTNTNHWIENVTAIMNEI